MPPSNRAHPLLSVPNEVLQIIVAELDVLSLYSIRLSGKELRRRVDTPPPMSVGEYVQFQRQFEAHASRKLRSLYCPSCNRFNSPTPSKTSFTDAQAVRNLNGRRSCIECAINNGHFDKRDVVIKKKHFFSCGGCKTLLTLDKEETAVTNVVIRKDFPYHDDMNGRAAEITIGSGGKRWCKTCRAAFGNLGASGAVKVRTR